MSQVADLLRRRETQGLRIGIYVHLVVLLLYLIVTSSVSQSAFEDWVSRGMALVLAAAVALFLIPLRKERGLVPAGFSLVVLDTAFLLALPHFWLAAAGGDAVPQAYLVKTITLPVMTAASLILNAVPMRPLFIGAATISAMGAHSFLLWRALSDPRTGRSIDWVISVIGPAVNVPLYITVIFTFFLIGALLFLIAMRARKTVLQAIGAERLNMQFGRYFSPAVRTRIQSAPEDFFLPGGKMQEVVVLFSDIRGFTALSEQLGAAKILAFLALYQKAMLDVIFKHGGTLDKFIGDGILATFGTPEPLLDDADRAAACTLDMKRALKTLNEEQIRRGDAAVQIGIGIHAGRAIVGNVGSEDRLEYTVIGDTVNTASRVEAATKEFNEIVLVTQAVVDRLTRPAKTRMMGSVSLRGKSAPITLYALDDL